MCSRGILAVRRVLQCAGQAVSLVLHLQVQSHCGGGAKEAVATGVSQRFIAWRSPQKVTSSSYPLYYSSPPPSTHSWVSQVSHNVVLPPSPRLPSPPLPCVITEVRHYILPRPYPVLAMVDKTEPTHDDSNCF